MLRLFLRLFMLIGTLACASCATPRKLPAVEAPGVVFIRDSLYLDEAEMANIHWLEYLYFLRTDSSEAAYLAALPDTTLWARHRLTLPDTLNDPYVAYYLRYPGFRYFPLVGVTQAQAEAYCRWRSAKVAERFRTAPELRRQRRRLRDYDVEVTYRLPTAAEWELAARGGLDSAQHPYGYLHPPRQVRKYDRITQPPRCANSVVLPPTAAYYRTNANVRDHLYYVPAPGQPPVYFRCDQPPGADSLARGRLNDGALITEYRYAYPPNGYGLYNMIGNVAELTTTPGQAKGGSFEHPMAACRPDLFQPYAGPQEWLGFRCACTIRVRRKAAP